MNTANIHNQSKALNTVSPINQQVKVATVSDAPEAANHYDFSEEANIRTKEAEWRKDLGHSVVQSFHCAHQACEGAHLSQGGLMRARMPFTPLAQPGESPLSLLRRSSVGNGQKSTLRFAYALNPDLDHSPMALSTLARNPQLFRTTCVAAGISDRDVQQVAYSRVGPGREDDLNWNGLQVPVGALTFHRSKTCPRCVLEQGYAQSEWDHRAAVACSKHQVLLRDACPTCRQPWTFNHDIFRCGCDAAPACAEVPEQAASLLNRLISLRDKEGLRLLDMAWKVLHWWEGLGLRLRGKSRALALWRLHSGRWPEMGVPAADSHAPLHPRLALAPLLDDPNPATQALASRLLGLDPTFSDGEARELCTQFGCYDQGNHSKIYKDFGNRATGSKNAGWKLTNPGLVAAAGLLKT